MSDKLTGIQRELFDHIKRKGPITIDTIVENVGIWSRDGVYDGLSKLEDEGFITSQRGDIAEHGTTRRIWMVDSDE